jgi:threonine synthase
MKLNSTKNKNIEVDFGQAVLESLPKDNGLYMPTFIPPLSQDFFDRLPTLSFPDLSFEVANHLLSDSMPEAILSDIVHEAINFEAPLVHIHDNIYTLELYHGPTLAFKDFGARFMSRVMNYYRDVREKLYILVATSGDTGGAVASGFYNVEGIEVIILFPKGKVSPLQQKQLTTLGGNIRAIEIDGTFDDCQVIVKNAFLDEELRKKYQLSSANSINISRLIPQSFYYFNAVKQLNGGQASFVVPSGNFGNITAGIMAHLMGLKVNKFIAATNINDVVPNYLETGEYHPKPSKPTISNAMDVGNPSNFPRMIQLLGSTWNNVKKHLHSYSFADKETKEVMKSVHNKYNYTLDPHGAVGYLGAIKFKERYNYKDPIIFLETAHPSKFKETVEETLKVKIDVPYRLAKLSEEKESFFSLSTKYQEFKDWFIAQH